jgi:Uma2 family endonuclease
MAVGVQSTWLPTAPGLVLGPIYRLSVNQYLQMARAGILTEEDRVELVEGVLVTKMGRNPPHILVTKRIYKALTAAVPRGWTVSKEDPFEALVSVPEPDCLVMRGSDDDYRDRLPEPQDVALVVEVSETSLAQDQQEKKRTYARAAIPVYWIVNLISRRIEVYGDPTGPDAQPDYHTRRDYGPDDEVPVVIAGREVGRLAVRDLLP